MSERTPTISDNIQVTSNAEPVASSIEASSSITPTTTSVRHFKLISCRHTERKSFTACRTTESCEYTERNRKFKPAYDWADEFQTWQLMCNKDEVHFNERLKNLYRIHRNINASMRCLLIDWIMEVSTFKVNLHQIVHLK